LYLATASAVTATGHGAPLYLICGVSRPYRGAGADNPCGFPDISRSPCRFADGQALPSH